MNTLEEKLQTARKNSHSKLKMGLAAGGLLVAIALPVFFFTHTTTFRITPQVAADNAVVTLAAGAGWVAFNTVYVLGGRAVLQVESPGFAGRTAEVDFTRHMRIEMREAPVKVRITTAPPLAQTQWRVNGVYAATAGEFSGEFQPGAVRVEVDHEFYRVETLQINAQRGKDSAHHLKLTPVAGAITIASEPAGARVVINGAQKGITPLQLPAMPGGPYRLQVELDGYATVEEQTAITNRSPAITRNYRLSLRQAAVRVTAAPAGGILRIDGVPTEAASLSLPAGRKHLITYEKPGYVAQSKEVSPGADEQVDISFNLKEARGEVIIRTTPPAGIFVNGAAAGATPQTLRLQTVAQNITLERAGYRTRSLTVTPNTGAPLLIDEKLALESAARLAEAAPFLTAAGGVKMKFFNPRRQSKNRFTMGAPRGEKGRRANEFQREVELTKAFYVSVTEITEAQFARFGKIQVTGKKHPVRAVSWMEAAGFCNWMSEQDGLQPAYNIVNKKLRGFDATADGYRLLSEAEWEWLARIAGRSAKQRFVWGNDTTIPAGSGNFADESARGSAPNYIPRYNDGFAGVAPVASFASDAAGLYDMAGNVSEWVYDIYDLQPPRAGRVETDPFGGRRDDGYDGRADGRVIKGANFRSASLTGLRSSFREGLLRARDDVGFRVARYLYGKE